MSFIWVNMGGYRQIDIIQRNQEYIFLVVLPLSCLFIIYICVLYTYCKCDMLSLHYRKMAHKLSFNLMSDRRIVVVQRTKEKKKQPNRKSKSARNMQCCTIDDDHVLSNGRSNDFKVSRSYVRYENNIHDFVMYYKTKRMLACCYKHNATIRRNKKKERKKWKLNAFLCLICVKR